MVTIPLSSLEISGNKWAQLVINFVIPKMTTKLNIYQNDPIGLQSTKGLIKPFHLQLIVNRHYLSMTNN